MGKSIVKKATWALLVLDMGIAADSVPVFCSGVTEEVPPILSGVYLSWRAVSPTRAVYPTQILTLGTVNPLAEIKGEVH